jgi:hypothetical protein
VEEIVRELKSNLELRVLRKHRFTANSAWLLMVMTGHKPLR